VIDVEKARKIILDNITPLGVEMVTLRAALSRILGENIYAPISIPPFNNSAMDGFAVRSSDTPGTLEIIEDLKAGDVPKRRLGKGQAARIMTGAQIPKGADAVVMVEDTEKIKNQKSKIKNKEFINILKKVTKGENIRKAGEDVKKGELVIPQGSVIRPQELGMLAALGKAKVKVYKKPKVAILATGDELLDVDEKMETGKIRSSNSYTLYGQVIKTGGEPIDLGIVRDNPAEIKKKIKSGLIADMILTSGGVSVGDYDLVKGVLKELGTKMKFWKVAMKPGKPLVFGLIRGKPVFGLPGNPVSSMVAFEQFVKPALYKMVGRNKLESREILATLKEDIEKKPGRKHFLRGYLRASHGGFVVTTTGPQGSGMLNSMLRANALIVLNKEVRKVKAGEKVCVQLLE